MRGFFQGRAADARMGDENAAEALPGAGRQVQMDFGTFTLPWGRRPALVVVLSHSRLLWRHFSRRQTIVERRQRLRRRRVESDSERVVQLAQHEQKSLQ